MTFLTAVTDSLVAVVHDACLGHARLSVPLYSTANGALQQTITCAMPEESVAPTKLVFVSRYLCVLFPLNSIVAWDIERGVHVHTWNGEFVDMAISKDDEETLFCLTAKSEKLHIQAYSMATGKLVRKIKCSRSNLGRLALSATHAVVYQGDDHLRIVSLEDGSKVGKYKLSAVQRGARNKFIVVQDSLIVAVTSTGIALVSLESQELVGEAFTDLPVVYAEIRAFDRGYHLLVVTDSSVCQLYEWTVPTKDPLKPVTTITTLESNMSPHLTHSRHQLLAILETARGEIDLRFISLLGNDKIVVTIEKDEELSEPKGASRQTSVTTTLGPGQVGGESQHLSDLPMKKKQKTDTETPREASITERLEQLANQMTEDTEEEEEEDTSDIKSLPFHAKKATTESLENFLTQALQSGDDAMLELSLAVRDKRAIQISLESLEENFCSILLTKLTTRLAGKPNRAVDLALWIQLVLESGKIRHVQLLRPLRNLLQERVESFPYLLKLEGRLSALAAASSSATALKLN